MNQTNEKNKALRESCQRAVKTDAAAVRKQEVERARKLDEQEKPFVALGRSGKDFVYFVKATRRLEFLNVRDHEGKALYLLAPCEYWDAVNPGRGVKGDEGFLHCQKMTGSRSFNVAAVRGAGIWKESGRIVYNAGSRCFTVDEKGIAEVASVFRDGHVYISAEHKLPPAPEMMTDEEGKALLSFFCACPWQEQQEGELFAGLVVQGLLGGYLPKRVHAWITAPAGTGKSTLLYRVSELTGHFAIETKGGTEAGVRQKAAGNSLPVFYDEAEPDTKGNTNALLDLARFGTDMGVKVMGGETKSFLIASSFLFFSVNAPLERAADVSRFMHLRLKECKDKSVVDDAFHTALSASRPGALIARLMVLAPIIETNIELLKARLGSDRRAEVFAHVFACAHALKSQKIMSHEELEQKRALFEASDAARVEESDAIRALNHLMDYKPERGGASIRDMLKDCIMGKAGAKNCSAGYGVSMIDAREGGKRIFICDGHRDVKEAYQKTEWEKSCKDSLLALSGSKGDRQRLGTCSGVRRGVSFPAYLIFPELHEPSENKTAAE